MVTDINTRLWFGKYKGLTIREVYQGTFNADSRILMHFLQHIFDTGLAKIPTDNDYLYRMIGSGDNGELLFDKTKRTLAPGFLEIEFLESINVSEKCIHIYGELFNPELGFVEGNYIILGDLQKILENFISYHFKDNSLGILDNLKNFRKIIETNYPDLQNDISAFNFSGDMSYLLWSERNISDFQLDAKCKLELEALPVAKITGINLLYIGNETYEYIPVFETGNCKFPVPKT
jgi:hypothetical protein